MKRERLSGLLGLLDRLIEGEKQMPFREFDLSGYFRVLAEFKRTHSSEIVKRFRGMEPFDDLIAEMKARQGEIAERAVRQYGSFESYTAAMREYLRRFLSDGPSITQTETLAGRTGLLTRRLTEEAEIPPPRRCRRPPRSWSPSLT